MTDSPGGQNTGDRVHVACEAFEELLHSGRKPRIEDYLATASPDDRISLFKKLLETEVSYRFSIGQQPTESEYAARFRPHGQLVQEVLLSVGNERVADVRLQSLEETIVQGSTDTKTNHGPALGTISSLGRYELSEVLGKGGFGTVYRAWDGELGREVAIKVLHGGLLAKGQDARRFVQEAQTAAKLNHPNICPVYDMGQFAGTQYIVMGLVKGKSLDEFIESGKTISPRQAVHTIYKLTSALTEAHRQGIVHRDLKPANIMIEAKRSQLMILDFGLARQLNANGARLTLSGEVLGTPLYMAPEQARGEVDSVGPRSDIYSLGVILYRMLAGRAPFAGSVAEVFAQILYEEPDSPSAFLPSLSPDLDAICLRAIAKDPNERYQSMAEFGSALADFLKGKRNSAAPSLAMQDSGLDADWLTPSEMEVAPSADATAPSRPIFPASSAVQSVAAPSNTTCPKCNSPMPSDTKLCNVCGFHQGLQQHFDVIATQHDTRAPERQSWLAEQLYDGETPEGLALAVACITPVAAVIFAGLLYGIFGAWALLVVGLLFVALILVLAKIMEWRIDPASLHLYFCRMRAWRTMSWPSQTRNVLDMRDSRTVDADLESLKEKWKLEVLDLENTQVTDAGLEQLARLGSLRFLVLRRTQASAEGIDRLRRVLPRTRIWF